MSTGLDVMDRTVEKTNKILIDIENELGWIGRRHQTYHAMRTVLHALRDRLPIEGTIHLSSQLPLFIKGVLFDGWNYMEVPIKWHREEFINHIGQEMTYSSKEGIEDIIRAVLYNLFKTVDPGEANKIINTIPADIAELFCHK